MQSQNEDADGVGGETVTINGKVKWFNTVKGFGFVTPDDGAGDVFLHLSCLRDAGFEGAEEGTPITCEAQRRSKGLQATRVVALGAGQPAIVARPSRPRMDDGVGAGRPPRAAPFGERRVVSLEGVGSFQDATVKWFNPVKGYGFLSASEGGKDVFIHMEELRRVGLAELQPGQAVRVRIGEGPKGPQVAEME